MPLPRWLARFNRKVTNPALTKLLGGRLPVVVHIGRVTSSIYRTPVAVFERSGRIIIPLTYGSPTEWARNVVAADECRIERRRGTLEVVEVELMAPPDSAAIIGELPILVRFGLWCLRAKHVVIGRPLNPS